MCIYCGTSNYRKIYEHHHGIIPIDEFGRTYEIHHIDGNHDNNVPSNLKAVTLQEHYTIHYNQKDYAACLIMASQRMDKSPEEISKLARENNLRRMERGEHHFQDEEFQKEMAKIRMDKIKNGSHHLLGGKIQRKVNFDRVAAGTHNFLDKEASRRNANNRVLNGTHPFSGGNKGTNNSRFNPTLYKFQNIKTGEIISMTMFEFRNTFKGTSIESLIKGKLKSTGGWKLITE